MMDDLAQLDIWCQNMLAAIGPAGRAVLARTIAADLRTSNRRRIASQTNVDGSAYAPRVPRLRKKQGRLRRAMFPKLRGKLNASSSADAAILEFASDVSRVASVHHYGLRDRVSRRGGTEYQYPSRELIGISNDDIETIKTIILSRLAK